MSCVLCDSFQELDLSKEAFFFNDTPKELEWTKAVAEALHPDAKYALVRKAPFLYPVDPVFTLSLVGRGGLGELCLTWMLVPSFPFIVFDCCLIF